jgi:hypothetical protein
MFEFNTADPAHFCAQATALRQQYRLLQAGERLDSAPE